MSINHPFVKHLPDQWYGLAEDAFTQLLINPGTPQLRVVGSPEFVSIATRSITTSGEDTWSARVQEPACCAIRLTRQEGGALEVWKGCLLSFDGQAFARLASMGRPYWREIEFPPQRVGLYSGRRTCLLSYCQLQTVDATHLAPEEVAAALVLRPVSVHFG